MITIIDTYKQINEVFENGIFSYEKWERYINSIYPEGAHIFKDEIDEYTATGEYTFEKDFLPHIQAVYKNPKLEILHDSFLKVVEKLNERIQIAFGKGLNVDIVLYLGLGNAAGWVTNINGCATVLLGVEKIIELDWCDYYGYGDVGYFLGNKFVHSLLKTNTLNEIVKFEIDDVHKLYTLFVDEK